MQASLIPDRSTDFTPPQAVIKQIRTGLSSRTGRGAHHRLIEVDVFRTTIGYRTRYIRHQVIASVTKYLACTETTSYVAGTSNDSLNERSLTNLLARDKAGGRLRLGTPATICRAAILGQLIVILVAHQGLGFMQPAVHFGDQMGPELDRPRRLVGAVVQQDDCGAHVGNSGHSISAAQKFRCLTRSLSIRVRRRYWASMCMIDWCVSSTTP